MRCGFYEIPLRPISFSFDDVRNERQVDLRINYSGGAIKVHKDVIMQRSGYIRKRLSNSPIQDSVEILASIQMVELIVQVVYGISVTIRSYERYTFISLINLLEISHWINYPAVDLEEGNSDPITPIQLNIDLVRTRANSGESSSLSSSLKRTRDRESSITSVTSVTASEDETAPPSSFTDMETDDSAKAANPIQESVSGPSCRKSTSDVSSQTADQDIAIREDTPECVAGPKQRKIEEKSSKEKKGSQEEEEEVKMEAEDETSARSNDRTDNAEELPPEISESSESASAPTIPYEPMTVTEEEAEESTPAGPAHTPSAL